MSTFNEKQKQSAIKLITEMKANSNATEKLLSIVTKAFSERSLEIVTPKEFLELLLSPTAFETSNIKLEGLKRKYLLSLFREAYVGEKIFHKLSEVNSESERDKEVRNTLRDVMGMFNTKEKIALKQHNHAVNKIDAHEKITALSAALKECCIGGHSSLLILKDIAKILIGKKIGRTEQDVQKDKENTMKQKQKTVLV